MNKVSLKIRIHKPEIITQEAKLKSNTVEPAYAV